MRFKVVLIWVIIPFFISCESEKNDVNNHFFLDEYPELEFRDRNGGLALAEDFLTPLRLNGTLTFQILDSSLVLYKKSTFEPYSGFIRTYYRSFFNVEAIFEDGKIKRLRYWHPNRQLGMDMDYGTGMGQAWTLQGILAISWVPGEIQYRNTTTNVIKQIITDTMTTYFDSRGDMTGYTKRTDSSTIRYYPDGKPQFLFPAQRTGVVKRWYPNGQLQAEGRYENGTEVGTWIQYDSLGNVIRTIVY